MAGARDPRVGDYIANLPPWQQRVCTELRELLHEADPDLDETIRDTRAWAESLDVPPLAGALTAEREAELLDLWRARV